MGDAEASAEAAAPALSLQDLPACLAVDILLALSPTERARCGAVCRAWRVLVAQPAAWAVLELRCASAATLHAAAARSCGALRSLTLRSSAALAPADVIAVAQASRSALRELRVEAPCGSDSDSSSDGSDGDDGDDGAWRGAFSLDDAAALHFVPRVALPVWCDEPPYPLLRSLLEAGRVCALWLDRAALLPVDAADVAQAVLAGGARLRLLSLRYNSVGHAGTSALAALAPRCAALRLSFNDVGDAGAAALADGLVSCEEGCALRSLELRHCGIGPAGAAALAGALRAGAPLSRLDLAHCPLGAAGARALAEALRGGGGGTLTALDLGHCALGRVGVAALARAGAGLGRLRSLALPHNSVCPAGAAEVARLLRLTPALASLRLGSNALGDAGLRDVCAALRGSPHLRRLSVPLVNVGPAAARRIAGLLRACPALHTLDASSNALGAAVAHLAGGLHDGSGAMRRLRLRSTGADDAAVHALARAMRPDAGGGGLEALDLRACPLGDDAACALAAAATLPGAHLALIDLRGTFLGAADAGAAQLHAAAHARQGRLVLRGVPAPVAPAHS